MLLELRIRAGQQSMEERASEGACEATHDTSNYKIDSELRVVPLGGISSPAVAPVVDQVIELPALRLQESLDAQRETIEIHLALVLVREQYTKAARGSKKKVAGRWRNIGERITELVWRRTAYLVVV